jgi:multimeric flavodoxin WrbA
MERTLLGIGCGHFDGSAEVLLKAALRAAEATGATVELVRLDDLHIPSGPDAAEPDDIWWLWEKLVLADALIISTPIITRTVAARLKLLGDRLLGANADAAFIEELLRSRGAGSEPAEPFYVEVPFRAEPFRVDGRVLKPRVAGFIAVGGSQTSSWKTLTLPMLHMMTFSMQIAVVDQVQFAGASTHRAIVLDDAALSRAEQLGRNVAGQMGRTFEDAEYLGDDPGVCPMCHLDIVVLQGNQVECATCGALGSLTADGVTFDTEGLERSVISMQEKRTHFAEIRDSTMRQAAQRDEIERRAAAFASYDRRVAPVRN